MKITAEPRSDQWNADDFIGGWRAFTIEGVKEGAAEQKYDVILREGEGRVWRPPLTILRLLIKAWGEDSNAWVGRLVVLYRDDSVRFGKEAVGGIRILAMSDLPTGDKPFSVKLTESRGKRATYTVQPALDEHRMAALRAEWEKASTERRAEIQQQVAALQGATPKRDDHPVPTDDARDVDEVELP